MRDRPHIHIDVAAPAHEGAPFRHARSIAAVLGLAFIVSSCSLADAADPPVVAQEPQSIAAATVVPVDSAVATSDPSATPSVRPSTASETVAAETTSAPATSEPSRPKKRLKVLKLKPRPKPGPFETNLYRKGDFMHQQTKNWCVAGSTQTMMNIIDDGRPNRSAAFQKRLYFEGRRLSRNQSKLGAIGVDLSGWADLLNSRGYGPYTVAGSTTRRGAIKMAAKALRMTGKPVGIVAWRGAHSWVMSGFTASADPALTNRFEVRKVFVQDTWYPYVSTIWGASRPPNAAIPVAALAEDFLPYRRPSHRWPKRDGKYMLILPQLPKGTVAR